MVVTENNTSYVAPGVANRKARQQILIVDSSGDEPYHSFRVLKRILIFWSRKRKRMSGYPAAVRQGSGAAQYRNAGCGWI